MISKAQEIRAKSGYPKSRIAAIAGIGLRSLERVEAGETGITVETLLRVALAYGCSVADLYPPLSVRPTRAKASPVRHPMTKQPPKARKDSARMVASMITKGYEG